MECLVLSSLIFLILLLSASTDSIDPDPYAGGIKIQMMNGCYDTIYPYVFTKRGLQVTPSVFKLDHLDVYDLKVPDYWSGTIWAQTSCSGDTINNTLHCAVGECGYNNTNCHHRKIPPVTLLNFNLEPEGGISSYRLDLRYGFNVPVTITPSDNHCKSITCVKDLRVNCPDLLAKYDDDGEKIACKSACYATWEPKLCCTGAYAIQDNCQMNEYTQLVMNECPDAVYNVFNETRHTCFGGISYGIIFCP